ncbi:dipeptide ABC transporter ATP-binding protein [Cohaesibacter celericrescens]|uniref:Peptide ABC transporter ATP-binding protein n=1 Tax=Cohaesibacter celericrescens TaxID=2067669 RepID=A0A2N5XW15_9HYPH|nr:dipeptide ABC transporter ATP-binding protein [Cohaesibacter celericrescens]PLW78693.1 peptide ABC transporter ATP-binding protein [Cohaesibacter celericrescens]
MNDQTSPILHVRDITRDYVSNGGFFGGAEIVRALKGIDFELFKGETLALVGESGCGKSTLARILTLIDAQTSGTLNIQGTDINIDKLKVTAEMRRTIQIVFQNPYGSLNPRQKVGAVLEEPLIINNPEMSAAERRELAMEMLIKVGLEPVHFGRYPHMFSGGQRQRIAIGRALMLRPKILVLDEPVSALDLSIQAQILNLLKDLQDEFNLSYLFISHDLSVVKYLADRVMVMYFGEIVEHGTREEVFNNPQHDYTKTLLSATPQTSVERIRERIKRKAASA